MRKLLLLMTLLASPALAQSPTFSSVTITGTPAAANQAARLTDVTSRINVALPSIPACSLAMGTGAAGSVQALTLDPAVFSCSGGVLTLNGVTPTAATSVPALAALQLLSTGGVYYTGPQLQALLGSGGTTAPAITVTTPTNVTAGTQYAVGGSLTGYSSPPTLSYAVDGGTPVTLVPSQTVSVSSTVFSFFAPSPTAGAHTITVRDGNGVTATSASYTAAASGTSPPAAVTALSAGTPGATTVALTWTNATGATAWAVTQRLTGSGAYAPSTLSVAATATGATVSGLAAQTGYDFQVTDSNAGGSGPAATLTNITTAAAPASPYASITPAGGTAPMAIDLSVSGTLFSDAGCTTPATTGSTVLCVKSGSGGTQTMTAAYGGTLTANAIASLTGISGNFALYKGAASVATALQAGSYVSVVSVLNVSGGGVIGGFGNASSQGLPISTGASGSPAYSYGFTLTNADGSTGSASASFAPGNNSYTGPTCLIEQYHYTAGGTSIISSRAGSSASVGTQSTTTTTPIPSSTTAFNLAMFGSNQYNGNPYSQSTFALARRIYFVHPSPASTGEYNAWLSYCAGLGA